MNGELNYDEVWAMFQETDRRFKETAEQFKETDRQFKETDKQFKATDRKLLKLERMFTGQWGKLIESLVEGDLVNLLNARGIPVNQTGQRIKKRYNKKDYEIDLIARNGKEVVFVEVKTTLKPDDVLNFTEKLKMAKTVFPEYSENILYGTVAYLRSESNAEQFAIKNGLLVIKATGKSASIINDKEFQPAQF